MERFAIQAFLDGFSGYKTRQDLLLGRADKLVDTLSHVMKFETAKQLREARHEF